MTVLARFGRSAVESDVPVACLSADSVGSLMCIRDEQTATGRWRVQTAEPTDVSLMPAIGVLTSKLTPTTGIMRILGTVEGVFSGLDVKKPYFVGDGGTLVNPAPVPSTPSGVLVQKFGFPVSNDVLSLIGETWMVLRRM